jgi:hypothetical protein
VDALVEPYLGAIVVALVVAIVVLLVGLVILARRTTRLGRRLDALTRGEEGDSFEEVLEAHLERVHAMGRQLDAVTARTKTLEERAPRAFQRVGLVRYNPFEDTGGNQSFALALLDANGDGWVLSSLHARAATRVYAKVVKGGRSDAALSEEEAAAIRQASA